MIRGPELKDLRIVHLEPAAKPPTMTVEATISAHRYVESRNTGAVLFGSKTRQDTFCEQWDLALTHHPVIPWRITARHDPPVRIFERLRATVREIAFRLSDRGFPRRP